MRRGFVIAATVVVVGCGGFLSAFGEDPQPDPGPGVDSDASFEATVADGGATVDGSIPTADGSGAGDAKADAGPSRRVFVSSATFDGDALAFPNWVCANLGGAGTWRAWISHPLRQAVDEIGWSGPWRRMDGVLVAQNKTQLTSGKLAAPINIDEKGNPRDAFVWTGTSASGSDLGHCDRWTKTSGFQGRYGQSARTDEGWTSAGDAPCTNTFAVYCFEE